MERVHYKYLGVWLPSTLKWSMQVSKVPVCKKNKNKAISGYSIPKFYPSANTSSRTLATSLTSQRSVFFFISTNKEKYGWLARLYLATVPGLHLLTSGVCYLCTLALLQNCYKEKTLFEPQ